jgi:hypothetical protein
MVLLYGMPHREQWQSKVVLPLAEESWSRHARRDLQIAISYLHESTALRRSSVSYSAAALGALIAYGRPFTERADPAANQSPALRRCFLAFAADLGADLHLHAKLLQMRDEIVALSDVVSVPAARLNARCFRYPDQRLARITCRLDPPHFNRLAVSMRIGCEFYQAEILSRIL